MGIIRDLPHVAVAPSVDDPKKEALFYTNAETLRAFANFPFSSKIAENFGLVRGGLDPKAPGVRSTNAVFRGLKRDQIEPGYDEQIYAYVANPGISFALGNEDRKDGKLPRPIERPKEAVFVTYVLLATDRDVNFHPGFNKSFQQEITGQILDWEWVMCSPENSALPENWEIRYEEEKWIT